MTSSIHQSSSLPSKPYSYENISNNYQSEVTFNFDRRTQIDNSHYYFHVDRLFEKITIHPIHIEPPPMTPDIENRLFLPDITRHFDSLASNWDSSLKKLENLPRDSSTEGVKNLLAKMAYFSQISRDISNKRYEFQKG